MKALAAEATVRADSMSAVSLLAARLLRNLIDTVVKDGDRDPAQKSESDNLESESDRHSFFAAKTCQDFVRGRFS